MPTTEASRRAVNKYMKNNYDRVNLILPKGKRAELQALAESKGLSLNRFISNAIDASLEQMKNNENQE